MIVNQFELSACLGKCIVTFTGCYQGLSRRKPGFDSPWDHQ